MDIDNMLFVTKCIIYAILSYLVLDHIFRDIDTNWAVAVEDRGQRYQYDIFYNGNEYRGYSEMKYKDVEMAIVYSEFFCFRGRPKPGVTVMAKGASIPWHDLYEISIQRLDRQTGEKKSLPPR